MDWNAVFEDEGDENGDFSRTVYQGTSRVSLVNKFFDTTSYTPMICFVFTVNYLLGVGCLGIPRAFLESGLLLGVGLVVITSFVSYVTTLFIANGAERVLQTRELGKGNAFRDPMQIHTPDRLRELAGDEKRRGRLHLRELLFPLTDVETMQEGGVTKVHYGSTTNPSGSSAAASLPPCDDMPEVIEIVAELLNPSWVAVYQASLLFLTSTGLLAYTQVFVSAFLTQILPGAPIVLPTILFGAIVVPLSCLDLNEQITTQVVMSALRFVSIAMMLIGMVVIWLLSFSRHDNQHQHDIKSEWFVTEDSLVNAENAGLMFSTALFAQLFQHSVPGLLRPLARTKKRKVPQIFQSALCTTGGIYIVLGVLALISLRGDIEQAINLNFVGFSWGISQDSLLYYVAKGASLLIVLFPAFDTISIFPLIANTLGNNLQAFAKFSPSGNVTVSLTRDEDGDGEGDGEGEGEGKEREKKERNRIFFRLVASVPPVLCSLVLRDLTTALQMAGIFGVIVALVVPALIQIKASQRASLLPPLYKDSPYDTFLTRASWLPSGVLCFSMLAFTVVIVQFVKSQYQ